MKLKFFEVWCPITLRASLTAFLDPTLNRIQKQIRSKSKKKEPSITREFYSAEHFQLTLGCGSGRGLRVWGTHFRRRILLRISPSAAPDGVSSQQGIDSSAYFSNGPRHIVLQQCHTTDLAE